jgi:hypothetical protein
MPEAIELEAQTDESGNLLPKELMEQVGPERRFRALRVGEQLIVWPASKRFYEVATKEQWVQAFRAWVDSHTGGPDLPGEAFSRGSIYDS